MRSFTFAIVMLASLAACKSSARESDSDSASRLTSSAEVDPIDPDTGLEVSCQFSKVTAHPDPSELIREYLRRDAEGQFTSSNEWFDSAVDCPGHLPGPDTYSLIADYHLGEVSVDDSLASVPVTFRRLAQIAPNHSFDVDNRIEVLTVTLVRTKYGWRIHQQTLPWLNIQLSHAFGLSHSDSVRADSLAAAMRRGA